MVTRRRSVSGVAVILTAAMVAAACGDGSGGTRADRPTTSATEAGDRATLDGETPIDFEGIGPIQVGMTITEAERAAGRTLVIIDFAQFGGHCYFAYPQGMKEDVLLTVLSPDEQPVQDPRDGIVGRASSEVQLTSSPAKTKRGIGIGASVDEVRAAYRDHDVQESKHHYIDGLYIDVKSPSGGRLLRFESGPDGRVFVIHGGRPDAVTLVEGCA